MLPFAVVCLQEKWVYDNRTFNGFAKHYKTGKTVPSDMFAKIKGSQTYRKGGPQGSTHVTRD
jgi:Zn-dependent oligopeptidase